MPRPDFLPPVTHYGMSDVQFTGSTTRRSPDQLALQTWADAWTDAHIPRTDRPVRFSPGLHQYGHETPDYGRLIPTHRYSPSFTHR